jgi:hypothetical protein
MSTLSRIPKLSAIKLVIAVVLFGMGIILFNVRSFSILVGSTIVNPYLGGIFIFLGLLALSVSYSHKR